VYFSRRYQADALVCHLNPKNREFRRSGYCWPKNVAPVFDCQSARVSISCYLLADAATPLA